MTRAELLQPRLLSLPDVQRVCGGIGRDLALEVMHGVGVTRLGRRIFVRPENLDRYIESLSEKNGHEQVRPVTDKEELANVSRLPARR